MGALPYLLRKINFTIVWGPIRASNSVSGIRQNLFENIPISNGYLSLVKTPIHLIFSQLLLLSLILSVEYRKIKIASFWYPYSFTKCVRNLRWYTVVKSTTGYAVFIWSTQNLSILLHWDLLLPWEWKKLNSRKYMALGGGPKWRVKFGYPKIVLIFSNIFYFRSPKGGIYHHHVPNVVLKTHSHVCRNVDFALCIMHNALCIMHNALCIMHNELCIMHNALCIMHIMHYA